MRAKRKLTDFGMYVKKKLLDLGMEQRDLIKEVGMSETYLIDIMYGGRTADEMKKRILETINRLEAEKINL